MKKIIIIIFLTQIILSNKDKEQNQNQQQISENKQQNEQQPTKKCYLDPEKIYNKVQNFFNTTKQKFYKAIDYDNQNKNMQKQKNTIEKIKKPTDFSVNYKKYQEDSTFIKSQITTIENLLETLTSKKSNVTQQFFVFSKIGRKINTLINETKLLMENEVEFFDLQTLSQIQNILFQFIDTATSMKIKQEEIDNKNKYFILVSYDVIEELKTEIGKLIDNLAQKCFLSQEEFVCQTELKDKSVEIYTVISELQETKILNDSKYYVEYIDELYYPAASIYFNYSESFSIYDLTYFIRFSQLRISLINLYNIIESRISEQDELSKLIFAIQETFNPDFVGLKILQSTDGNDISLYYNYNEEKIQKFKKYMTELNQDLQQKEEHKRLMLQSTMNKINNVLDNLVSYQQGYLDQIEIELYQEDLNGDIFEIMEEESQYQIKNFLKITNKLKNSKIYKILEQYETVINNLKSKNIFEPSFEKILDENIECLIAVFGNHNLEIFNKDNKFYYKYDYASIISLIISLNNIESLTLGVPKRLELKPFKKIIDQLLLILGKLDFEDDYFFEQFNPKKIRRIVVIDILQCKDCVQNGLVENLLE